MESKMTAANATSSSWVTECPRCRARYRVDPARIGSEGAKLRCARCQAVFRVAPAAPAETPTARPMAPPAPAAEARREAPAPPAMPGPDAPLLLVAVADPDLAKRRAALLAGLGVRTIWAGDGVEAILAMQRHRPAAALLDAQLERMSTSELCELAKRNESLRAVALIRIGGDDARARSEDAGEFAPDAYLDAEAPAAAVAHELARLGVAVRAPAPEAPPVPAPISAPLRSVAPSPRPPAAAAAPAAADAAAGDPEIAKAERLARIVVSDIVLYNPDKFTAAVAAGNVVAAMADELAEGRTLFEQRIGSALRARRDFLVDELLRVARSRGMR
jgi:predicted Zn finger-like uncharacterized protein